MNYERAVERWLEFVADNVPPDLTSHPIYFVSSNMHSLANLFAGSALGRQAEIIDYIQRSDSDLLRAEYEGITSDRVRSSLQNFLYYAAKKYLSDPRNAEAAAAFAAEENATGITTLRVPFGPDVDAQVIELRKLRPERIDGRLADLPALDRLAASDAVIVNVDYPLGQSGYFLQRALARKVGALLGLYVMGKGATLTGRVGDILLCNIVADERTATTYLLHNCFNAEDVERYLVYGTALDNQRAASARGTFLQNWGYLDSLHRAGNNLVEMEAGPYLEAFTELMLPERAPHGEMVNLVGAPVDLGFVHYASDTPYSKGQTLGERNLSYFGMDSTYAAALAYLPTIPPEQESVFDLAVMSIQKRVRLIGQRMAGIPNLSPHDCRHSAADRAARNGATLQELMEYGGWRTTTIALGYLKRQQISNQNINV